MSQAELQSVSAAANVLLEKLREPSPATGAATGIDDLDALTGGLHAGDLWTVTGRPGAGKSILALGWARTLALQDGGRAVVLSRRESPSQLAERVLSAEGMVGLHHLRAKRLSEQEWSRLEEATQRLVGTDLQLGFVAEPAQAALGLQTPVGTTPHGLVVVDDVFADRERLSQLQDLKQLASRLRCTVIAVLAYDSREIGAAEQEAALTADVVLRLEDRSGNQDRAGEADLVVTHHRRGPVSRIGLANQMHYARFVNPPR